MDIYKYFSALPHCPSGHTYACATGSLMSALNAVSNGDIAPEDAAKVAVLVDLAIARREKLDTLHLVEKQARGLGVDVERAASVAWFADE